MGCKKGYTHMDKPKHPECDRMCVGCENFIPLKTPMPKIKPCLFCGKIPEFDYNGRSCRLRCNGNEISVSTYWTVDERHAIRLWNSKMQSNNLTREILHNVGEHVIGLDMENEYMLVKNTEWFKALCKKYSVKENKDNV